MPSIERRIGELERQAGAGIPKFRMLNVFFEKRGDEERATAKVIARDEVEKGALESNERYIIALFGPAGRWIETPEGARWQYPDGSLTDDPAGTRRHAKAH